MKTERKPIHFSSDVLVAVASLHVKVRNRFYSHKRDLSTDWKYLFQDQTRTQARMEYWCELTVQPRSQDTLLRKNMILSKKL